MCIRDRSSPALLKYLSSNLKPKGSIRFKGMLKAAQDLAILPVFCGILGSKRATSNFK